MIPMVHILVTEVGEFQLTEGLATIYRACKIRRDGQPDSRTRYGKLWYKEFGAFRQAKMAEYLAA